MAYNANATKFAFLKYSTMLSKIADGSIDQNDICIDKETYKMYIVDGGELKPLGSSASLDYEIVETLPTTDIKTGTFYYLKTLNIDGDGNVIYDQYLYIDSKWVKIGTSGVGVAEDSDITNLFKE